jgi:hydroxypyruvate isomerase
VPEIHRRQFVGACAAATLSAAAVVPGGVLARELLGSATPPKTPALFSVMLWTVEPKLTFEQRIAKVSEAGYHAVELVNEYNGWSSPDFARARQQLHQRSMVVDACSGIEASLCDSEQRDLLLRQIRANLPVLSELGCARLILLTGNVVPNLTHEQMHTNCVEALKQAADVCAPQKVEILLENIDPEENPKYFLTSVTEGFQIIREVNRPDVRFLYDFFHEQLSEGNLIAKLEKNLELIGLVHVADVPGRHAPGTGEINYANIFRKLGRLGYSHYIGMEFLPTDDVVSELRNAREYAQRYLTEGQMAAHASSPENVYATA